MPHPDDLANHSDALRAARIRDAHSRYWQSNRRIVLCLLLAWAVLGLGCGVLFAEPLNAFSIGGCPLGFWFAQQGSIVGFVLVILLYATLMAQLDRRHRREVAEIESHTEETAP